MSNSGISFKATVGLIVVWVGLAGLLAGLLLFGPEAPPPSPLPKIAGPPPDFTTMDIVDDRKAAFFGYFRPIVDDKNAEILNLRDRIESTNVETLDERSAAWMDELVERYRVNDQTAKEDLISELLLQVDVIPSSLVLAQAAKESGWGTSRFATEGYNYFGQRCYSLGCGLIPLHRPAEQTYQVRRYDSPADSVSSYMHNLNTHPEYRRLRELRAEFRNRNKPATGIALAEELTQYSERRRAYVDEIQSLIHFNKLDTQL